MSLEVTTFNSYFKSENYQYFQIKTNELSDELLSKMEEAKQAINITVCVDRSGSMFNDNKLNNVKETLYFLVDQLRDIDQIGLVLFDDNIEIIQTQFMTKANKEILKNIIKLIHSRGSTNISSACLKAIEMLSEDSSLNDKIILFLTDGIPNQGIIDSIEIISTLTPKILEKNISLYTFGYGSDHDHNLLSKLASICNGSYSYIKSNEDVMISFANCLGGIFTTAIKNIEFTFKIRDGIKFNLLAPDRRQVKINDNETLLIMGNMTSGETKDFLVSFKVDDQLDLGECIIKYHNEIDGKDYEENLKMIVTKNNNILLLSTDKQFMFYDTYYRIELIETINIIESIPSISSIKKKMVDKLGNDFIEKINNIKEIFPDNAEYLKILDGYITTIKNIIEMQNKIDFNCLIRECSNGLSSQSSDGRNEYTKRYTSKGKEKMITKAKDFIN